MWKLGHTEKELPDESEMNEMKQGQSLALGSEYVSLLNIKTRGKNITCCAISSNAKFIACSDRFARYTLYQENLFLKSKLYYVEFPTNPKQKTVVQKLSLPKKIGNCSKAFIHILAATRLTFSSDSTLLVLTTFNYM